VSDVGTSPAAGDGEGGSRQTPGAAGGPDERRVTRLMMLLLLVAILAGIGLLVLYALGGQVQLEGILLFLLLTGIGFTFILWSKYLIPPEIVTEDRGEHPSSEEERLEAELAYSQGEAQLTRRSALVRMLLGAFGALGLAAIFPIRSLGPSPGRALFQTSWRAGLRAVDEAGNPVTANALSVGGVLTVFPEGHIDSTDSVAILVRVDPADLKLPDGRDADAPFGNVCYSKLCTHAGCPVGLYLAEFHQLQCPCHFSAFAVLEGAKPVFGPAARPLPQLPLEVDQEGYLVAKSDFTAPVGPGFWNRGSGP
jgi:ubiquinol-cytochrome c reductase iron-sulfur subunit